MPLKRPTTTPLPDEIYDEWAPQLGEAELKVLLYIVRRTLGFRKGADAISLAQFLHGIVTRDGRVLDHGCGVKSRPNVVRALKSLEVKGLIDAVKAHTNAGDKDVTIYALRWEDGAAGAAAGGSSETKPPGGAATKPPWFRCDTEVVSEEHHGSVAATPTTNSTPTHSQQNSVPPAGPPPHRPSMRGYAAVDAGTALWNAVLEEMALEMTEANYAHWLAPTTARGLDGQKLVVSVPRGLHQQWLDTRLRARIEQALRRLGHDGVQVTFAVAP